MMLLLFEKTWLAEYMNYMMHDVEPCEQHVHCKGRAEDPDAGRGISESAHNKLHNEKRVYAMMCTGFATLVQSQLLAPS